MPVRNTTRCGVQIRGRPSEFEEFKALLSLMIEGGKFGVICPRGLPEEMALSTVPSVPGPTSDMRLFALQVGYELCQTFLLASARALEIKFHEDGF